MLKAQQGALLQSVNQGIITIRNWEISYYSNFFLSFGAQAAVIGGFSYAALTQVAFRSIPFASVYDANLNQTNVDDYYLNYLQPPPFKDYYLCQLLFWFFSVLCLALAILLILVTIFLQVYGPRLALYGPEGSLAKTATVMREEYSHTFKCFVLMIVMFALSTLFSFWALMSLVAAIVSTIGFLLICLKIWYDCSMIYNMFLYDKINHVEELQDHETPHRRSYLADLSTHRLSVASTPTKLQPTVVELRSTLIDKSSSEVGNQSIVGYLMRCCGCAETPKVTTSTAFPASRRGERGARMSMPGTTKTAAEGYFTVPNDYIYGYFRGKMFSTAYVRRYFYLSSTGNLYYYVSKAQCPAEPLCIRPIQTWLYSVKVVIGNSNSTIDSISSSDEVGAGVADDYDVLEIHMTVDDPNEPMKLWVLPCDTIIVLNEWVAALKRVKAARLRPGKLHDQ